MKKAIISVLLAFLIIVPLILFAHEHHSHQHGMTSTVDFRPSTIEELERFHGHLGPFVVLGAKMGEHAHTAYEMPQYFGVTVKVEAPASPPPSCLIDGLQLGTGATMGKGNIEHIIADEIKVTIIEDLSGKKVIYQLKDSTLELLDRWAKEDKITVTERGRQMFKMKAEELFEVQVQE